VRPLIEYTVLQSVTQAGPSHGLQLTTAGISLKTQELYALVFICRYLDLFYSYISL
jgi:hypothetical protein